MNFDAAVISSYESDLEQAFGSFIIAVVQMIRWIFRYYMYQIKKLDQDGTFKHVIALLTCIGECCLDWYVIAVTCHVYPADTLSASEPHLSMSNLTEQLGTLFEFHQQERLHPDCHHGQFLLQGRRRRLPSPNP